MTSWKQFALDFIAPPLSSQVCSPCSGLYHLWISNWEKNYIALFFVDQQPIHLVTHFPIFHPFLLLADMFFSFPQLVYSCVFPTERPQGQRGLAVPMPPTRSFFAGIVGKVLLWCPCHDQTPLLLEERALQGWGSKDWSDGEGMMRGMDLHQKRGIKSAYA